VGGPAPKSNEPQSTTGGAPKGKKDLKRKVRPDGRKRRGGEGIFIRGSSKAGPEFGVSG